MQRDYQRGYKACDECRKRKTRCDLGGSDQDLFAFTGPPCAYCRRTRRECVFRDERNVRKRPRLNSSPVSPPSEHDEAGNEPDLQLPINNTVNGNSDRSPTSRVFGRNAAGLAQSDAIDLGQNDRRATSSTIPALSPRGVQVDYWQHHGAQKATASDLRSTIGSIDFAHPSNVSPRHVDQSPATSNSRHQSSAVSDLFRNTVISKGGDCIEILSEAAANAESVPTGSTNYAPTYLVPHSGNKSAGTSPVVPSPTPNRGPLQTPTPSTDTLSVWKRFVFVKSGLLTPEEVLTYIDAFFSSLSPRSPVLDDYFADHKNHHELLLDEPFLCSTILMISSRYHALPGITSTVRGQFIHDQLWTHLKGLIQDMMLGQGERAGFRLRTLGTIEALLLMTEWYARTMQFNCSPTIHDDISTTETPEVAAEVRNQDIVEPSRRFDRMSWMFLGIAQMLAHELGILQDHSGVRQSSPKVSTLSSRSARARGLLFIYVTLLAAKLGYRSMIALTFNPVFLSKTVSPAGGLINAWIELLKLTKTIHASMFSTKAITRDLLQSGNYIELLEHFAPLLSQWQRKHLRDSSLDSHDATKQSPEDDLLILEYLYVRMYSYSPALQALTLRVLFHGSNGEPDSSLFYPAASNTLNMDDLAEQPDYSFICHVIHDAQQIVKRAIVLARSTLLRFYPARSFQRVISACVFLLKANLLGIQYIRSPNKTTDTEEKAEEVTELLRQCVWALKNSAIDDAHLATYYAALLEGQLIRHSASSTSLETSANSESSAAAAAGENRGMLPHSKERNGTEGAVAADWQATLNGSLDDIDLFADFAMFGEFGFTTDTAAPSFDL